jgi:hypothetical protein
MVTRVTETGDAILSMTGVGLTDPGKVVELIRPKFGNPSARAAAAERTCTGDVCVGNMAEAGVAMGTGLRPAFVSERV